VENWDLYTVSVLKDERAVNQIRVHIVHSGIMTSYQATIRSGLATRILQTSSGTVILLSNLLHMSPHSVLTRALNSKTFVEPHNTRWSLRYRARDSRQSSIPLGRQAAPGSVSETNSRLADAESLQPISSTHEASAQVQRTTKSCQTTRYTIQAAVKLMETGKTTEACMC
jgi:hypothetical protein